LRMALNHIVKAKLRPLLNLEVIACCTSFMLTYIFHAFCNSALSSYAIAQYLILVHSDH
jgi:hypothetical protein